MRTGRKWTLQQAIWLIFVFGVCSFTVDYWSGLIPAANQKNLPTQTTKKSEKTSQKKAPLGQLTEIRSRVYQSTAGLVYEPGSADGHRLDHVLKHTKDDPKKPLHGVFTGDRSEVLALIDSAWLKAGQGGPNVDRKKQNDRLVLTVDLQKRIGYVGGSTGKRRGNPGCQLLRLVVEEPNRVITAYPVDSW